MIDAKHLLEYLRKKMPEMDIGECCDIRSFKRNRSVLLGLDEDGTFLILVNGYEQEEIRATYEEALVKLKKIIKREFPRSNKVRVYNLGHVNPYHYSQMRRQKI